MKIRACAGVGSRNITKSEENAIQAISEWLYGKGWYMYSGHADGADWTFETHFKERAVIWLPWKGFNGDVEYGFSCVAGDKPKGIESVNKYHPSPRSLSRGGRALMARNCFQVTGMPPKWPVVEFVLCCADPMRNGGVKGGTGQAVRIAMDMGIPVYNLRVMTVEEIQKNILSA